MKRPEIDPIDLEIELDKMDNDKQRHINILALYIRERKLKFGNYGQLQVTIKRHLRAARSLTPFSDEQILEGIKKARKVEGWTLETLIKMLTK